MTIFSKLTRQGGIVVARDPETNEVLTDVDSKGRVRPLVHKPVKDKPKAVKESWRAFLARISNDGQDYLEVLHNIAHLSLIHI